MNAVELFSGIFGGLCFLFGVWYGERKEKRRIANQKLHIDCLKALAIVRLNYDKKDGMYSRWIYESLTYAIERISKIDRTNTYIGNERIPPFDDSEKK